MATVAKNAPKITVIVDGVETQVPENSNLIVAIQQTGKYVPTLCHHKDLMPNGSCRLCLVEVAIEGEAPKMVTSCNFPVREKLVVTTQNEKLAKHRKNIIELLLARFPNVPAVRGIAKTLTIETPRFKSNIAETATDACILCGKCIRACREFTLERILDFSGRGTRRHLTMPFGRVDPHCIGCTSCAYVCPTGAIKIIDDMNGPVDPIKIRNHGMKVNAEMATLDKQQCCMREVGTANIVDVMNKYDLLPCLNYRFGSHPDALKIGSDVFRKNYLTQGLSDGCWLGCSMACAKVAENFLLKTGPYAGQRVVVDGPEYETVAASSNMGGFDPDFVLEFNFYCDTYGLDTISAGTGIAFVCEAFEAGQINLEHTGGLDLHFGNTRAILELLHQAARGEGFGVDVGMGIRWLKDKWSREYGANRAFLDDIGMESKGLEVSEYMTKESLAQQAGYGLSNKGPQHDEAWLIFMDMVNNQLPTFEHKAEALFYFPLWRTWFGLWGLCKLLWNDVVPADNWKEPEAAKVPDHVYNYLRYVEGMTGIEMNTDKMLLQSARVYNLQRVMGIMLGANGKPEHDQMPYRAKGPVTIAEYESRVERYDKQLIEIVGIDITGMTTEQKLAALRQYREAQYLKAQQAAYTRRGWTQNGVPKISRLREIGIDLPRIVKIVEPFQND